MDTTARVVALTGRAGSGKSEAARVLMDNGYVRVKFADPLKDMLRGLFDSVGIPPDLRERYLEGDLKEEPLPLFGDKSPRHAMQTLGTEWGRECMFNDFWAWTWRCSVLDQLNLGNKVVVDDLRFPNELDSLKTFIGSRVIRIEGRNTSAKADAAAHVSEQYLVPADVKIANTGTIAQLHEAILEAVL